jgi:Secretion system C-terminal sorting domain
MKTQLISGLLLLYFLLPSTANAQQTSFGFAGSNEIHRTGAVHPNGRMASVGRNATSGRLQFFGMTADLNMDTKVEFFPTNGSFTPADMQPAAEAIIGSNYYAPGFFIAGNANMAGSNRMFLLRVGTNGAIAWCKQVETSLATGARAVVSLPNKNVIFVGMKATGQPVMTCFSPAGEVVWGPTAYNHASLTLDVTAATFESVGNRIIVTGSAQRTGETAKAMTFAVDVSVGNPLWLTMHRVSATKTDKGLDIASQVVAGVSRVAVTGQSIQNGNADLIFFRINPSDGTMTTGRIITETSTSNEAGHSICATPSGGWAIAGRRMSDRVFFMSLSSTGSVSLTRTYPEAISGLVGESITPYGAGRYYITSHKTGLDYMNIWVDGSGQSRCANSSAATMSGVSGINSTIEGAPTTSNSAGWYNLALSSSLISGMPVSSMFNGFVCAPSASKSVITPCSPGAAVLCANPSGGQAPYTFQWTNGGITVGTSSCITVNPTASTIYSCSAKDATGCEFGFSISVGVLNSTSLLTGAAPTNVFATTAQVTANAMPTATGYRVNYRRLGTTNWLTATSPTLPVTLTGLSCSSNYEAYIRADFCGTLTTQVGVLFTTSSCAGGEGSDRSAEPIDAMADTETPHYEAFPNPTTGLVTLRWSGQHPVSEVRIMATNGKLVEAIRPTDAQQMDIDLSHQSSGMYFVQFIPDQGNPIIMRVIKN